MPPPSPPDSLHLLQPELASDPLQHQDLLLAFRFPDLLFAYLPLFAADIQLVLKHNAQLRACMTKQI